MTSQDVVPSVDQLRQMAGAMKAHFDPKYGGLNRAPKFPNPSIWQFLLSANVVLQDEEIRKHLLLTLDKMESGGIYDQVGGGFARYSGVFTTPGQLGLSY